MLTGTIAGDSRLPSIAVGVLAGASAVVAVALSFPSLRLGTVAGSEWEAAAGFGIAAGISGLFVTGYRLLRRPPRAELDPVYVGSFVVAGVGVFIWQWLPVIAVTADMLTSAPLGLPVAIFVLFIHAFFALFIAIPALVVAALAGITATAAVTVAWNAVVGKSSVAAD